MKISERDKTDKKKLRVCLVRRGWESKPCAELGGHASGMEKYMGKGPEAVKSLT